VSEFALTRKTGLNLAEPVFEAWDGFSFQEIADEFRYSMSATNGDTGKIAGIVQKTFSCDLPKAGSFSDGEFAQSTWRIVATGPDRWFVIGGDNTFPAPVSRIAAVTDQSDGWVGLRLTGEQLRQVLARLVGLDLHPARFPTGSAATAPIEGMHGILLCEDAGNGVFVLYFQRSSARDLVEHLRHAVYSTCVERIETRT
jgi:sarcosine oxidase subunit gamma